MKTLVKITTYIEHVSSGLKIYDVTYILYKWSSMPLASPDRFFVPPTLNRLV